MEQSVLSLFQEVRVGDVQGVRVGDVQGVRVGDVQGVRVGDVQAVSNLYLSSRTW